MIGMTVVGNQGNVYAVLKSSQYDGFKFGMKYRKITDKLEEVIKRQDIDGYISMIRGLLMEASDYGLEFIER